MAGEDQKAGVDFFDPLKDALERLADEDLSLDLDVGKLLSHHLRPLEVGLRQLQKTLVDDVVMEFLLLLELEDLRGLDGKNVLDVTEDGVVILHVESRAHMELRPELPGHLQSLPHGLIRVRGTVDTDDPVATCEWAIVLDDQRVLFNLADDPRHHPTQL